MHEIEQRFGEQAYPKRILMAEIPHGSTIIPNSYNRIPGFSINHIHCMPGFPEMAWPMMEWLLNEHYAHLVTEKPVLYRLMIENTRESALIDPMTEVQSQFPQVKISSLPRFLDGGGYQVEMGVRGSQKLAYDALQLLISCLESAGIDYIQLESNCESGHHDNP